MFFTKGNEDLGLDASLSLLDLSPSATIDDANQAYSYLHRMIDLFHRDANAGSGDRQEDLELLACAYEKAVSYLSDQDPTLTGNPSAQVSASVTDPDRPTTDLHFTINFPSEKEGSADAGEALSPVEQESGAVENAVAIISRRLQEAEAALDEAKQAVEKASAAVDSANARLEKSRQERIGAMIAAKSAKSRALLMEIEAKRATEEAIAVAEKVKERVHAARQAAKEAKIEADRAQEKIHQVTHAEETAAAEAVCAEDHLEKASQQLKTLTHAVVEARSQLRMFEDYGAHTWPSFAAATTRDAQALPGPPPGLPQVTEYFMDSRQQILSDLMEIENCLNVRKKEITADKANESETVATQDQFTERRQHERLYYPRSQQPVFSVGGQTIPVLDISQSGLGLGADVAVGQSHLVRGVIVFEGLPSMNVTGRVVRMDEAGVGLRLVTRIGNHILDRERTRLAA